MKVLITPASKDAICFWCRARKKECVTADFSNGFLRRAPLCFECLERATRVQFAVTADAESDADGDSSEETRVESGTKYRSTRTKPA